MRLPPKKNIREYINHSFLTATGLIKITNRYETLSETFIQQVYYWLAKRLKPETTVLDLGANIGDTAIYFAMNPNVKSVYSYEPIPKAYKEAKENIAKASEELSSKIFLFNAAITGKETQIRIDDKTQSSPGAVFNSSIASDSGIIIEGHTLASILIGKRNVVIKCDIEGEEYKLFDADIDLSKVYAIIMEYHYGLGQIVENLKAKGFKVTYTEPVRTPHILPRPKSIKEYDTGYIYAER
jgi:FkbM family methyltransferase